MLDARFFFERLVALTRTLSEDRTLEEALGAITDVALDLLPGDHASVRVFDDSRAELLSGARSGEGLAFRPMRIRPGEGVIGWVATHGRALVVADTESDPRYIAPGAQGFEVASLLAVPLWSVGHVVGVLSVSSRERARFSPDDEVVAQLLANCAVPPLERARLKRIAVTDPHTMAFNQGYLMPRLAEEIAWARQHVTPLGLLLMDLDHFKRVNDTWGHAAGDMVLREFADRVRAAIRRSDVLVRRGGEEFVLIMPGAGEAETLAVARRLRETIAATPFALPNAELQHQTVSIGAALWHPGEDPSGLEQRADAAMYEAKRGGRNRIALAPCPDATRPPGCDETEAIG
jgi:diguanylate cyclase (GGDEF)-like protein